MFIDPSYGLVGPKPKDGSVTVLVSISGLEMLKNAAPEQIRDLIDARCQVAAATLYHSIANHNGWETP